jgi:hypothetical protein
LDNFQGQPIISHMNRIIFLVFSIIFLTCSREAYSQQMSFDKTVLVGKEIDIFGPRHIEIDHKNNKFVVGCFKGVINIGSFTLETKNSISNNPYPMAFGAYLAKYDSLDNLLWAKKIAESDSFFDAHFNLDHSDNIIFSYSYLSKLYFDNDSLVNQNGNSNINLFKYSNDGILQLKKSFPGEAGISFENFGFDEQNNLIAGGSFGLQGNLSYPFSIGNSTVYATNADIFIIKFDSLLNPIWIKTYGGYGVDGVCSMQLTPQGIYLTSIHFYSTTTNNFFGPINVTFPTNYHSRLVLSHMDLNGNPIWARYFGSTNLSSNVRSRRMKVSGSHIYFDGFDFSNSQNKFDFQNGPSLIGPFGWQYYIACYDTSGNFIWSTISEGVGNNSITGLATDSNANVYAAGALDVSLSFPTDTFYSHGGYDIFVCSYDSVGNFRWATRGGGAGVDICSDITTSPEGKLYVVGGTTSIPCYLGRDTIYPPYNQSTLFYASMDSVIIPAPDGIQTIDNSKKSFTLYPNPTSGRFILQTDAKHIRQINVYSVLGERVFAMTNPSQQASIPIQLPSLPDGLYILKASNDEGDFTQSFLVQTK